MPVLLNLVFLTLIWVANAGSMLVTVKRAQLRDHLLKQKAAEGGGNGAAAADGNGGGGDGAGAGTVAADGGGRDGAKSGVTTRARAASKKTN